MIDKQALQQLINYSYNDYELISLAKYSFRYIRLNLIQTADNKALVQSLFKQAEQSKEGYLTDLFSFLDMDIDDDSLTMLTKDIKEIINNIKIKLCFLIVLDNLLAMFAKNAYLKYDGSDSTPILSSTDEVTNTISAATFMLLANNQKYLVEVSQPYSSSKNRTDLSELKDMTVHVFLYKYKSLASSSPSLEDYCSLADLKQRIEHRINFGRFE